MNDRRALWYPSEDRIQNSNMTSFTRYVETLLGKGITSYQALYDWSINDIEEFWKSVWVISGLIHSHTYEKILSEEIMPGAKWFEGAKLNFAENLLKYRDSNTAIISAREGHPTITLTYEKLFELTAKISNGLRELGVKKGDRVAGYVTNTPEAIIAMLAATSIGALWSSCSPDFGIQGVVARFGQIKPKILFAIESYSYNGKTINCTKKLEKIVEKIPEVEKVILIDNFEDFTDLKQKENFRAASDKYITFNNLMDNNSTSIEFEQLSFDHPVYIMYSSGTTGVPKCIVHGAGGTLLQHFKELSLHTNLGRHDIITFFTTCGWMMWNWLVSSLNVGAAIFLYDGSPVYPSIKILWEKIDEHKITIFGTSPKYLSICQKSNLIPKNEFSLASLKTILSTGSPLSRDNFNWVYLKVKEDVQLSSISGGTDIISCFMLGNPNLPVYWEEIQCRGLGMKVEAINSKNEFAIEEKGELVCTKPFPSMPVYFWNDPDGEKYRKAYFEKHSGIWTHGDFIKITSRGGVIVYGRSDATLNPGGVRIGTAEIYRIVETINEVSDSIVVGQKWGDDVRIILFVVLKNDETLDENFSTLIRTKIRNEASPRHVPSKIIQVTDVPRTISGKKVEVSVAKILNGERIDNVEALANPECLNQYREIQKSLS
jgi:acetoacetyl-CoA synthetase